MNLGNEKLFCGLGCGKIRGVNIWGANFKEKHVGENTGE